MSLPAKPLTQEEQERERAKYVHKLANVASSENRQLLTTTFQTYNKAGVRRGGTVYNILCDCEMSARELTTEQALVLVANNISAAVASDGKVRKRSTVEQTVHTWRAWLRKIGNPTLDGVPVADVVSRLHFEPDLNKPQKNRPQVSPTVSKVESSRVQFRSDAKLVLAITGRKYDTNSELDREAKEALLSLYKLV